MFTTMDLLQKIASYPDLLFTLRLVTVSSMIFISGLSFCLSTWVIPNMFLAPPETQVKQFIATVTKGAKYLMSSSRILMTSLLTTTVLTAFHPDSDVSSQWTIWAGMACILITAAPYEIYFIFPINDIVAQMDRQQTKDKKSLTRKQETELKSLLRQWAARNFGRVALPLLAGLIGLCNL